MRICIATRPGDVGRCFLLRYKVFVTEQGFAESIEIDEHDNVATFLMAKDGESAVGTLRLFKENENVILGRMAVDKAWRGKGVGKALIREAAEIATKMGGACVLAHAQVRAVGFYVKAGFEPVGEAFDEEGVRHRLVRMVLPRAVHRPA